ncbi:HAMP domain-containing methyl-accepting chemotaxis protein [Hwanghaeella sp.]|uniref:HAMP domain-containing methyl-accepting chemotaxis protein n=1 Tax=Hwanghaeella sp. TaxID=2605943 RepID=UPI003CCB9608
MPFIKKIDISTKIYGGFGAIVILLLIIGGTAWWGLKQAGSNAEKYRVLATQTAEIGRVQASMLEAQLLVENFLVRPSTSVVIKVAAARKRVESQMAALSEMELADETRATLNTVAENLKAYFNAFTEATHLEKQRVGIIEKELSVQDAKMEANISELVRTATDEYLADVAALGGEVMRSILIMRNHVAKFLVNPDRPAFEALLAESAKMDEKHAALAENIYDETRAALSTEVLELHPAYRAASERLFDTVQERTRVVDETLTKLGSSVVNDMATLADANAKEQAALGEDAKLSNSIGIMISVVVSVVSVVLALVLAWLIGAGISKPIQAITQAMTALAGGDRSVDIPGQDHRDEIGAMADAVQVFKENMIRTDEMRAQQEQEARGREERAKRIEELTRDFDRKVGEVLDAFSGSANETEQTSASMSSIAQDTNRRATTVAEAADQTSENVQSVAAATEQLSHSSSEIGRQVSQSAEIAVRAVEQAQKTDHTVQGLAEAAKEIGQVVQLIQDIAEQTNLLALNATIEAARAGEAGKGFAVVANEVKSLATQTAKATGDIGRHITSIQGETQAAVSAIQAIARTVDEINSTTAAIAAAVEQQVAATGEITRSVDQAATGAQDVSSNIGEVTRAAGETGSAAGQMTQVAGRMKVKADELRQEVESFLSGVRAA